ncbi:MAG: hypothetical protein QUV05_24025 [Phycisphaerae bacterium]|nr:hypothetical protein [Phycisphaerae bacterium]
MTYRFANTVKSVVDLLVAGRYAELERLTAGTRLSADDMAGAIRQYGRVLVTPPEEAYEDLDAVQVRNASPPRWSVRMSLWTVEEGRSDLSLELTVAESGDGYLIEVDDIHVL